MIADSSHLSVDRKAALCSGRDMWESEAIPELGLAAITLTDGPHGVRLQDVDGDSFLAARPSTCFPTASGLAASWDRELIAAVGAAIGEEARSLAVGVVLGPGANIKRHPLGGRNFEYFSEDPLLTGELAAAMIIGMQSAGAGACLKHFAVNNQETSRMGLDVIVDERALHEIYLAGFETAVRRGRPWSVMCSYNKVNGEYCADSARLLTHVLRNEWGFDGVVVSDWGAVHDRVAGLQAGLDLAMPGTGAANDGGLTKAIESADLEPAVLDRAAERVRSLIERVAAPADRLTLDIEGHHELARRAAAESAVLLTNDAFLPLDRGTAIAVIGAFAVEPRYQGAGSSLVTPTRVDGALDSIRTEVGDAGSVTYAAGYEAGNDRRRTDLIAEAVSVAARADVAVVLAGLPPIYESEGFDRDHLRLPRQHDELISAVTAANPDTVVVLCNGAPVEMPWVDEPGAIVEAYLGGQGGGSAIADVLFGVVNPSGKLAETFPVAQADVSSDAWFPGHDRQVQYREGIYIGYRWTAWADRDPLFPFGHGLSYTTFAFSEIDLEAPRFNADHDDSITVSVTITNTGARAGAEVAQLYVREIAPVTDRPDRELKGFEKAYLEPGESRRVSFELDARSFAFFDTATAQWLVAPGTFEILIGSSSADIHARATLDVDSGFQPKSVSAEPRSLPDRDFFANDAAFAERLNCPIPGPPPVRPFNRDSTIDQISAVWIGRRFRQLLLWQTRAQFGEADETAQAMLTRGTAEAPLRVVSQLTQGQLSMSMVDKLVWLCNHWPSLPSSSRRRRR